MIVRQANRELLGLAAFLGLAFFGNVGCGGEAPTSNTSVAPASSSPSGLEILADAIGTMDNGHLEFTVLDAPGASAPAAPGLQTENFGKTITQSKFTFSTAPTDGPGQLGCTSTQYCADVTMTNPTGAALSNVFVEVTDYFAVLPVGTPISWAGGAFPFTTDAYKAAFVNPGNIEAANYGTIASNGSALFRWKFNAGASTRFAFHVKIYASVQRTAVAGGYQQGAAAGAIIDACSGTNVSKFFIGGDDGEQQLELPFPYTSLTANYDHVVVGANGYALFYSTGDTPPSLTATNSIIVGSGAIGLFPFWDDLGYDSDGGVCVSTSGTAPNRLFRITWQNAKISTNQPVKPSVWSTEKVTNSISIQETNDYVRYYYAAPTNLTTLSRGGSADCGWRGPQPKGGVPCGSKSAWIPAFPFSWFWQESPGNP